MQGSTLHSGLRSSRQIRRSLHDADRSGQAHKAVTPALRSGCTCSHAIAVVKAEIVAEMFISGPMFNIIHDELAHPKLSATWPSLKTKV